MKPEPKSKQRLLDTAMQLIWAYSYGTVSVDDICQKSGVNKGSFYYFFESKSDLTAAAMESNWEHRRVVMDKIFSPLVPPLERLNIYCTSIVEEQKRGRDLHGKILGCPFCSVGCELSTQNERIRLKANQVTQRTVRYFDSLVRDLSAAGLVEGKDPEMGHDIQSFVMGCLTQAKIENSLNHVEGMKHGILRMLGISLTTNEQPAHAA